MSDDLWQWAQQQEREKQERAAAERIEMEKASEPEAVRGLRIEREAWVREMLADAKPAAKNNALDVREVERLRALARERNAAPLPPLFPDQSCVGQPVVLGGEVRHTANCCSSGVHPDAKVSAMSQSEPENPL